MKRLLAILLFGLSASAQETHSNANGIAFASGTAVTAVIYDELYIPAGAMLTVTNLPATLLTYGPVASGDCLQDVWSFSGAGVTNYVEFNLMLPDGWDQSTVKLRTFLACNTANAGGSNTNVWEISAGSAGNNENLDAALLGTSVYVTNTWPSTSANYSATWTSPAITVGGSPADGHMIWFRLGRRSDHADDVLENAIYVLGAQLQFKRTTLTGTAW